MFSKLLQTVSEIIYLTQTYAYVELLDHVDIHYTKNCIEQ